MGLKRGEDKDNHPMRSWRLAAILGEADLKRSKADFVAEFRAEEEPHETKSEGLLSRRTTRGA
jgi:hypothetical protein